MELNFRPAVRADFTEFYDCCFPHDRARAELRAIVAREWHVLLESPSTFSFLVIDSERPHGQRVAGCAQATFISEALAQRLKSGVEPWVNSHATRPLPDGSWPLLNFEQIRDSNSRSGLIGLMTRWTIASQFYESREVLFVREFMLRSFSVFARGYNIKELFTESTGEGARQESFNAGFRMLNDYSSFYGSNLPPPHASPCLFHLTRESAWSGEGHLAAWAFAYQSPRYGFDFSLQEQRLLRWAMTGIGNEECAYRLERSIWSVHKYWNSIFARVESKAPLLFPAPNPRSLRKNVRGEEKRSLLLKYLQDHPEELCAYDANAAQTK